MAASAQMHNVPMPQFFRVIATATAHSYQFDGFYHTVQLYRALYIASTVWSVFTPDAAAIHTYGLTMKCRRTECLYPSVGYSRTRS